MIGIWGLVAIVTTIAGTVFSRVFLELALERPQTPPSHLIKSLFFAARSVL
ncbi:MAG: hypothetical protein HYZ71_15880 [Deltaproteobacteria bacterium]|nr:hypothetical protein [Deltaproteobacteria bacterium]